MFRRNKVETIPFKEFMKGDWKEQKAIRRKADLDQAITSMSLVGVTSNILLGSSPAYASTGDIIMKAFDPIIQLVQGVSYPVAFLMISAGFILIMTGQTHRGLHFIKWACLGYLGLQFAPALMQIVIEIGHSIQTQVAVVK